MIDATTLQNVLAVARDYSLIALALFGLILGIPAIVMLVPLLRGVRTLRRKLPWFMHRAQTATATGRRSVESAMQVAATPFLWLRQVSAQGQALSERLRTRLGSIASKGR